MRFAWMVLLAGCTFRSSGATSGDDATPDAPMPDAASTGMNPVSCWNLSDTGANFHASACPTALAGSINVVMNTSLDTDSGKSNPSGLTCASLSAATTSARWRPMRSRSNKE